MVTPPPFHAFARLCVFPVPRKKCGDPPAHDVYHLDWESVRPTVKQVRDYCSEWDDGSEYYVVELEAKVRVVELEPKE
jgi:hypothetical protein